MPLSAAGRRALGLPETDDDSLSEPSSPKLSAAGRRTLGLELEEDEADKPSSSFDFGNAGKAALDVGSKAWDFYESAIEAPVRLANKATQATLGMDFGDAFRTFSPQGLGERVARAIVPDDIEEASASNLERARQENPRLAAVERAVKGFKTGLEDDPTTFLPFIGGPKVAAFYAPHMLKGAGDAVAEAAVEGIAGEGVTSPEFVEKGLGAGLQTGFAGLVGAEAAGIRRGATATAPGLTPERLNPEQAEIQAARARFEERKAAEASKRPAQGPPDILAKSDLDGALESASDSVLFENVRNELRSDMQAFEAQQMVANLRNFRQNQGLTPAITEALSGEPGAPRLGSRLPELESLPGGEQIRMSSRAAQIAEEMGLFAEPTAPPTRIRPQDLPKARLIEPEFNPDRTQPIRIDAQDAPGSTIEPETPATLGEALEVSSEAIAKAQEPLAGLLEPAVPEPAQVGAIAGERTVDPQLAPPDSTVNLAPEATGVAEPITTLKGTLPEPGNVTMASTHVPETRVPEGAISEQNAARVGGQAELLKAAGLEDFPLVPSKARKVIFDGDAALGRLKKRGQAVASDLGSVAGEGVGAIRDLAEYGASLLERGVRSFPEWSKAVTEALGGQVKNIGEHLQRAWETAQALWQKATASSEVGAVGKDISPLLEAEKARKIKPIPDKPVDAQIPKVEAREIDFDTARQYTDEDFANKIAEGKKLSKGELDALDERVVKAEDAKDAASQKLQEVRASGGDAGKANAEFLNAALDYATNVGLLTKNELAAKRALAAKAKLKEAGAYTSDKFVKDVFRQIPGVSNKQAGFLLDVFENRPAQLGDALRSAMKPGAFRKFMEWYKAMMLTAPSTDIVNVTGNTFEQGHKLAESAIAAGIDAAWSKVTGKPRERFAGEIGAEIAGATQAFMPALKTFATEMKDAFTLAPEKINLEPGKFESQTGAIGGKLGRAVRNPFRRLGAADGFFRSVFGEGDLYKFAHRKAARELGGKGDAKAVKARAAEIVKEARSDSGAHMDIIKEAAANTDARVFGEDPHALVQALTQAEQSFPALGLVLPFKKAPGNIFVRTLERSPLGFHKAYKTYRDYKAGKVSRGAAVDALARPVLGTAIVGGFYALAKAGFMVGGGPESDELQAQGRDIGRQKYSFVIPGKFVPGADPDSKVYIPFTRFEPASGLLGFAADMAEARNDKDAKDLGSRAIGSVLENLANPAYLQGLAEAADSWKRPKQALGKLVSNVVGSAVVPNVVRRAANAIDPVYRDTAPAEKGYAGLPEQALNVVKSRIPGLSETLPARKTGSGEDSKRPGSALSRFASPIQASEEKAGSAFESLMIDLGVSQSAPTRERTIPRSGGKKIRLEEDEYQKLIEADRKATEDLRRITRRSGFKRLDTEDQAKYIKSYYSRSGSAAEKRLWSDRGLRRRASQIIKESRT